MPTYQYHCTKCGEDFEFFHKMTDKPLRTCPSEKCAQKRWGKGRVEKQIGAGAGIIFKGSGFYITDYRSQQYKEAAKKESGSTTSGGETKGGGESKTAESKPTKTESKPATPKTEK